MNKDLPLVSVWMICFNHGEYIREALESVFSQEVDFEFEVVIGDDCSSDDTRSIILEFDRKYPGKITKLFHPENIGMIANQNAVFTACRGKYIAMLEGDDYWTDPCKLQTQIDAMERNPDCHLCFHPCRETKRGRRMSWYGPDENIYPTRIVILGGGYFCPTPSLVLRREVVESLPEFLNDAPAGDYYLQILGSVNGGALYLPRVMCAYRVESSGSWSRTVKTLEVRQSFRFKTMEVTRKMDEHLNFEFSPAFQRRYNRIYISIANDYMKEGHLKEFNECLDDLRKLPGDKSFSYYVVLALRRFPGILRFLAWCRRKQLEARSYFFHKLERFGR